MSRTATLPLLVVLCTALLLTPLLTSSTAEGWQARVRHSGQARGFVQRGFALPAYSRNAYGSRQAAASLRQISAAGAAWVQVNPTWYQDGVHGARIAPAAATPSDASVVSVIRAAHRLGLQVFLKPLVDLGPASTGYRGSIRPAEPDAWFASYTAFIGHYAALAARERVEEFGLGTELAGVSAQRAGWLGVVRAVRSRYGGTLLYAANFDEYRQVAFWDALDLVGIDAYWPVSPHATVNVDELRRSWVPIVRELAAFAGRTGRHILFTEAGYTSQRGATTAPWSWTTSSTADQAEQAAGYQALLASLTGQPWWAGVFWWAWNVPGAPSTDDPLNYSPHGKAAEAVVRNWWG